MKKLTFLSAVASLKTALFFLLLTTLFVTACTDNKKQIDALSKETETIHDEAMKEMADMNRVARELKQNLIAATMTPEQSAVYNTVLTNMGNAENNMMEWMKGYKSTDEMAPADALKYIQDQKTLIEKNFAEIKAALAEGKKLQGQ